MIYKQHVFDITAYINKYREKLIYIQYYNGKRIDNLNIPSNYRYELENVISYMQDHLYGVIGAED